MSATFEPVLVDLQTIQSEEIRWLWRNRVPRGKVTMFVGDPDVGKSFAALDIAAEVTRGGENVIILNAEDDPADTIKPRLEALRADISRVKTLKIQQASVSEPKERMLRLSDDMEKVEEAIGSFPGTALVIIDPLSAYMGQVDSRSDEQVRSILAPLQHLASRTGVAIIAIKHLNKAQEMSAIYRAAGSIAYIAAVRVALMFVKDKTDKDKTDSERRLVIPIKFNIGRKPRALAYRIQQTDSLACVQWEEGEFDVELEDAMRPNCGTRATLARDTVKDWLREQLTPGPRPATEITQAAKQAGFSAATLTRASKELGIRHDHKGGSDGRWMWILPKDAQLSQ